MLVEVGDAQPRRQLDLATVGRQRAVEQAEHRGLAATVRTDEAQPRARAEHEVEPLHDGPAAERLGEPARGQEPARLPAGRVEVDARSRPRGAAPRLRQLVDESAGFLDARLLLGAARFRALAQPLDLAPHPVRERLLVGGLRPQCLVARDEEIAVAPLRLEEPGWIDAAQLDHSLGHALEEPAVVADDEIGVRLLAQDLLEPEDALDVEMIRRLVHEEHVRRARQLAGDGQALEPAAGQIAHANSRVREAGARERHRHAESRFGEGGRRAGSRVTVFRHRRGQHALHGLLGRKARVLGHIPESRSSTERAAAAVRRLQPRQDAEQGGLARAIGTDEPHAVVFSEPERELLEQGGGAEGLGEALDGEQNGGRHRARERTERAAPSISATLSGRRSRLIRASSRRAALQVRRRRDQARVTGR